MFSYIVKRLLLMIVTLFGITVITFAVTRLTPGEPAVIAQSASGQSSGGYDSQLEQNRRNLGLDKPLLFNFDFEDRHTEARKAVHDFIRPARFWQQDARGRLARVSTIALPPALDVLERLQSVEGSVDHYLEPTQNSERRIDPADATDRLLELVPTLAQAQGIEPEGLDTTERIAFWREWYENNKERWNDDAVRQAVDDYLAGTTGIGEVLIRGGYAVPALIKGINSNDDEVVQRANQALSGITGFDYLGGQDEWEKQRDALVGRWNTFYAREKIRYRDFGPVADTFNIVANTQFGVWCRQVISFDFGDSYKHRRPVMELIRSRLPVTFVLSVLSILLSYLVAIPLGILSAVKKHSPTDKGVTILLFLLYSLPTFWVGQMLLLSLTGGPSPWPGVEWPEIFPARGMNSEGFDWRGGGIPDIIDFAWHLVLPLLCMTYGSLAFLSRQMRSAMLEVLNEDFIRTAMAKGASARSVIFRHALRNSLIPILTLSAGLLPELIAGSIIIESIFTIPGMGQLSFESILNRDYPVINAILFFSALLTLLGILIADLSYALADPRITYD